MHAKHEYCNFRFKIMAFNYLSIIQVTYFTKPSRFPMAYCVKFPLGKYALAWAAAKATGLAVRCTPISLRERGGAPISVRDGTVKLSPGCRAESTRSFSCAQI